MKLSPLGCSVLGALVALIFPDLLLSLRSPGSALGSTCFPFLPCSPGPFSGQGASASPVLILFPSFRKSLLPEIWYLHNCCLSLLGLLQQNTRGIKPVNPKQNQSCIFTERTDAEADVPIFWPPDGKSQLIGKNPDTGRDGGQEKKGATDDKMVGWHH